jgi:hypothetical protein
MPMLPKRAVVAATAVMLLLAGCTKAPTREDVPGLYRASYPFGTDLLSLNANGTYSQEMRLASQLGTPNVYRSQGVWSYSPPEGYPSEAFVHFDSHFLIALDDWGDPIREPRTLAPGGILVAAVVRDGKTTKIITSALNENAAYVKERGVSTHMEGVR